MCGGKFIIYFESMHSILKLVKFSCLQKCFSFKNILNDTPKQWPKSRAIHRSYYTYSHEPFHPLKREARWQTAEEAVSIIKSGKRFFFLTLLSLEDVKSIANRWRSRWDYGIHHVQLMKLLERNFRARLSFNYIVWIYALL